MLNQFLMGFPYAHAETVPSFDQRFAPPVPIVAPDPVLPVTQQQNLGTALYEEGGVPLPVLPEVKVGPTTAPNPAVDFGTGAPAGATAAPTPIRDNLRERFPRVGKAMDWAGTGRGQDVLGSMAGGLMGIEQPATTAMGSFARGFSQALMAGQSMRSDRAKAEADAEERAYQRSLDERRLAMDESKNSLASAQAQLEIDNMRADNARAEATLAGDQINRYQAALSDVRDDLRSEIASGGFGMTEGLSPEQQIEFDWRYEAERQRLLREYALPDLGKSDAYSGEARRAHEEEAAAGGEDVAVPPAEQPWGGRPAPSASTPPTGAGTIDDPLYGALPTDILTRPGDFYFYEPGTGTLLHHLGPGVIKIVGDE